MAGLESVPRLREQVSDRCLRKSFKRYDTAAIVGIAKDNFGEAADVLLRWDIARDLFHFQILNPFVGDVIKMNKGAVGETLDISGGEKHARFLHLRGR